MNVDERLHVAISLYVPVVSISKLKSINYSFVVSLNDTLIVMGSKIGSKYPLK